MPAKGFGNDDRTMWGREHRALQGRCWLIRWDEDGPLEMDWVDMQIAG